MKDTPAPESTRPKFKELPVNEDLKGLQNEVRDILRSETFPAGKKEVFDQYFREYFLPRWTQRKNLTTFPQLRRDLKNSLSTRPGEVHDHAIATVLEFMKNLVAGPYDPAVQINAILIIGDLNETELIPGSTRTKPLPAALRVLRETVENTEQSDALRVAAMIGILRHISLGISDEATRKSLTQAMLKLAAAEIPSGPGAAGADWLHGQVIDALGRLGAVGENNSVFKAILDSVVNENRSLSFSTRCIAAEAMGHLNYAGAKEIDVMDTAVKLAQFVVKTCDDEVRRATDAGKQICERRVLQCVYSVRTALVGDDAHKDKSLITLANASQKEYLAKLQKEIQTAVETIDSDEADPNLLPTAIEDLRIIVADWVKKRPR